MIVNFIKSGMPLAISYLKAKFYRYETRYDRPGAEI